MRSIGIAIGGGRAFSVPVIALVAVALIILALVSSRRRNSITTL